MNTFKTSGDFKSVIKLPKTFVTHLIETVNIFEGVEYKETKSYYKVDISKQDNLGVILEILELAYEQYFRDEKKMHLHYNYCNKIHYGAERLRNSIKKQLPTEKYEAGVAKTAWCCQRGHYSEKFLNTLKAITPKKFHPAEDQPKKIVSHNSAQITVANI